MPVPRLLDLCVKDLSVFHFVRYSDHLSLLSHLEHTETLQQSKYKVGTVDLLQT